MVLYKFVECGEVDWVQRRSVLSVSKLFDGDETIPATINEKRICGNVSNDRGFRWLKENDVY